MTGYQSKKDMANAKLGDDDDDTQVYKKPWVELTEAQIKTIEEYALTKHIAIRMVMETLKELNT